MNTTEPNQMILVSFFSEDNVLCPGGGGGGGYSDVVLDGGARLKLPNPYPSLRVILAEKGTPLLGVWRKRVPIIRDF